jgi:hypothetical protein
MKGLRFTVPLCRFVIALDSLQPSKSADAKRRGQTAPIQKLPSIRPKMLLRIIRIETPLEALLPKKPKASPKAPAPPDPDPIPRVQAPKKKASPTSKPSRARTRPASPRRKKK